MVQSYRKDFMNQVIWNKKALREVLDFPDLKKKEVGYLLYKLQRCDSLLMPHSKPMPSIGKGCHELRVKGEDGAYRVFYLLKVENHIFIFHAFKKKTQKTPQKDIELGKKNLKDMLYEKK